MPKSEATCSTDNADYDILNRRDLSSVPSRTPSLSSRRIAISAPLVARLARSTERVLTMRYYRDMSFKREIAEVTGVSINTALGRMRYAPPQPPPHGKRKKARPRGLTTPQRTM